MHSAKSFDDEVFIPSRKRKQYLQELLAELLQNNIPIAIIVNRSQRKNLNTRFLIAESKNSAMFASFTKESVVEVAVSLSKVTPWHRGTFCIIFANNSLIKNLSNRTELLDSAIPEIEKHLNETVTGYCFALDNGLVFYGNEVIQNIAAKVSKQVFS